MLGECQSAGTCDHWGYRQISKLVVSLPDERRQSLLNIGKMPFVIGKQELILRIENCDLDCCRTDVNSEFM